jgi:carboxyl-terminal processing protease
MRLECVDNCLPNLMKPLNRSIAFVTSLGLALITVAPAWSLRPELRLTAPTPEGKVTQLTAELLEQAQFGRQRLDDAMAAKLLDRYMDALDGSHELFLASDVAEFRRFLPKLAQETVDDGDAHPAHAIFARYLQRLDERAAFVAKTLADEKFEFTGHERYSLDREKAPRPRNAAEADQLWKQRLKAEFLQEKLAGKKPEQIGQTLSRRYARQDQMMKKLSADSVLEMYLNALAHIYDPHSDYMGHEELESFKTVMTLSLFGIGATLQSVDGYCKIRDLVPGGPAARSGLLKVGDRVVGVGQGPGKEPADLVDLPLAQAVALIRGPKGTDVALTIIPAGADDSTRKTITIRRDEIQLDGEHAKARIVDSPIGGDKTERLGIIDLPAFYSSEDGRGASATADVAKLLRKFEQEDVRGVILDLRRNGGGSLEEAINLTGLFIPSGPVVQTREPNGHIEIDSDHEGEALYKGPLIVLTSRFTASASEILAGALQDYGRAVIVGDSSTFGKGTVQTMLPLGSIMKRSGAPIAEDPGALKVTISKFYRPSGKSTQLRGVHPDIVLPSMSDIPEIGESAMKNPLEWDTVPSAKFTRFDLVTPYLTALRDQSGARIAADRDFAWLHADLALAAKQRTLKSLSLNEAERRKEKNEADALVKSRKALRLAAKSSEPTAYEITLKNAAAPGLPAPIDPSKPTAKVASWDDDGDAADASAPTEDIQLREAQRILADYARLLETPRPPTLTKR